jgi:hypothetical protein
VGPSFAKTLWRAGYTDPLWRSLRRYKHCFTEVFCAKGRYKGRYIYGLRSQQAGTRQGPLEGVRDPLGNSVLTLATRGSIRVVIVQFRAIVSA